MKDAATYAIPDFVDIILAGGERADEAMYYLLHERLNKQLKGKFVVYQHQLMDEFEDVVEDFFLYLREGKDGRSRTPYQSLQRIQKREAFESWMLSTFRNYLTVRADKEGQMTYTGLSVEIITDVNEPSSSLTDERKLAIVSHLIAFAHQVFYPHSRFIFLRSLLTILNKQQALPYEEMAKALGMTELSYRVSVHRMKCRLAKYRTLLLQGERLALDDSHQQQTLDTLKHADAVKQLRQEYLDATGTLLHESDSLYALAPSFSSFWTSLKRFLII